MKHLKFIIVVLIIFLPSYLHADGTYFPDKIFFPDGPGIHKLFSNRYHRYLTALKEPSIYQKRNINNQKTIRFTWLRTFDNPISLRLEINNEGTGTLYIKITNGAGGYKPGELIKNKKIEIEQQKISTIVTSLEKADFWNKPSSIKTLGFDGSHWIIEYLSNGKYHIVNRWAPEEGPVRDTGLSLLKLSGLEIKEIY